jgi:hypothetical protein
VLPTQANIFLKDVSLTCLVMDLDLASQALKVLQTKRHSEKQHDDISNTNCTSDSDGFDDSDDGSDAEYIPEKPKTQRRRRKQKQLASPVNQLSDDETEPADHTLPIGMEKACVAHIVRTTPMDINPSKCSHTTYISLMGGSGSSGKEGKMKYVCTVRCGWHGDTIESAVAGDLMDYLPHRLFSQAKAKANLLLPVINLDDALKIFESSKVKHFVTCSVQFN